MKYQVQLISTTLVYRKKGVQVCNATNWSHQERKFYYKIQKKEESTWELASKGETNFDRRDEIQVGKTTWDELQGLKITILLSQPNHPPML